MTSSTVQQSDENPVGTVPSEQGRTLFGIVPISRFNSDVIWNLGSLVFLGISGLTLNTLVGRFYGAEALGVFNQVLALYLVLSQISVGGFMFSTLSLTASASDDVEKVGRIASAALLLTAISATVTCISAFFLSDVIGGVLESPSVANGLRWVIPGLWCFSINKILLFSLNGVRRMRAYAVGQSLRFIFALIIIVALVSANANSTLLPLAISSGEILLLPFLLYYCRTKFPLSLYQGFSPYLAAHLEFAKKCYFSGLLLDINTKVDIIILGYFLSDSVVGVYSFAAMLVEGCFQIIIAVQVNVNPLLSAIRLNQDFTAVPRLLKKIALWLIPFLLGLTIVGAIAFSFVATLLTGDSIFASGWTYFLILMLGISLSSAHLSFTMILNQWGKPGWFTIYLLLTVIVNVVLNLCLIPYWGAGGSAVATALSFLISAFLLHVLSTNIIGVRLWERAKL